MKLSIMRFVHEVPSVMMSGFHVCFSETCCDVTSSQTHIITGTELEGLIALANKFNLCFYVTSFAVPNGFKTCFCVYL